MVVGIVRLTLTLGCRLLLVSKFLATMICLSSRIVSFIHVPYVEISSTDMMKPMGV